MPPYVLFWDCSLSNIQSDVCFFLCGASKPLNNRIHVFRPLSDFCHRDKILLPVKIQSVNISTNRDAYPATKFRTLGNDTLPCDGAL